MFFLLVETCRLLVQHLLHCFVYGLPMMTALFLTLRALLLQQSAAVVLLWAGAFLVGNALYIHASSRQMLKHEVGEVDIAGAFRFEISHFDFLLFVTLGVAAMAAMGLYLADITQYLTERFEAMEEETAELDRFDQYSVMRSIDFLKGGSMILISVVVVVLLRFWLHLCRTGVRIPALAEGYYIRTEEAVSLTESDKWSALAVSLLFVVAVTAFADILTGDLSIESAWVVCATWAGGYFVTITAHISMWTHMYQMSVKATGYHMARAL